jgi:N utilization substance protein B
MEVSGTGAEAVVREFAEHRFERDVDGVKLAAADEAFFAELVRGVVEQQADVDKAIVKRLAAGWRLERLDATLRAILRAGTFELIHRLDVPVEVVIDEYLEITKSFHDGAETGFVNGALDAVAKDARAPG